MYNIFHSHDMLDQVNVSAVQSEILEAVNNFFYSRLTAVPSLHACIERFQQALGPST